MEEHQREAYLAYAKSKSNEMQKWARDYRARILKILKDKDISLTLESIPQIIQATSFVSLSIDPKYTQHCSSCYSTNPPKPCHLGIENLNCLLCSCPNYDSSFVEIKENGSERIFVGRCKRESSSGKYFFSQKSPGIGVWDCSDCLGYHNPKEVESYLREHIDELQKQ